MSGLKLRESRLDDFSAKEFAWPKDLCRAFLSAFRGSGSYDSLGVCGGLGGLFVLLNSPVSAWFPKFTLGISR